MGPEHSSLLTPGPTLVTIPLCYSCVSAGQLRVKPPGSILSSTSVSWGDQSGLESFLPRAQWLGCFTPGKDGGKDTLQILVLIPAEVGAGGRHA